MWDTSFVCSLLIVDIYGRQTNQLEHMESSEKARVQGECLNYVALLLAHESSNWDPISNFYLAISLAFGLS